MKMRGVTLIESLIAMIILVTVISIAIGSLVQSSQSSSKELQSEARLQMEKMVSEVKSTKVYKSKESEIGEITYSQNISFVNRYQGVIRLELTAELNNEVIAEHLEFIRSR